MFYDLELGNDASIFSYHWVLLLDLIYLDNCIYLDIYTLEQIWSCYNSESSFVHILSVVTAVSEGLVAVTINFRSEGILGGVTVPGGANVHAKATGRFTGNSIRRSQLETVKICFGPTLIAKARQVQVKI